MAAATGGALSLAASSCDRDEPPSMPPPPERATIGQVARDLGVDAAVLVIPTDPPPVAGDLKTDIERFTSLDACVTERAALDPIVGDALEAIGYETFVRDACRVLEAAKKGSREPCAEIDANELRERCIETLAIVTAAPDTCPLRVPARPAHGRAATCVAIAARDGRLCAAEDRGRRARCEALASGDSKRCGGDEHDARAARCRRDVPRYRSIVGEARAPAKELAKPKGVLKLTPQAGAPPARAESDLGPELARGAVVVEATDGLRVNIGEVSELGPTTHVPAPQAALGVGVTVLVPAGRGSAARMEHFELKVPGGATLVCPGVKCTLTATAATIDTTRGGVVAVTIDGEVANGTRAYGVHLEATTFVRDVVATGAAALKNDLKR